MATRWRPRSGTTVHDSATLHGATTDAGGTISYAYYSDSACTLDAVDPTPATNDVVDGAAPDSTSHTFNSAGTFYWQATYSGDANNTAPVSSPCDEILVVAPNAVSVSTTLTNETTNESAVGGNTLPASIGRHGPRLGHADRRHLGRRRHDHLRLLHRRRLLRERGGRDAGHERRDRRCGAGLDVHQFNAAGTFYWQATYSGDANNNDSTPVTSPCDEILVVAPNEVTVSTTLTNEDTDATADGGTRWTP